MPGILLIGLWVVLAFILSVIPSTDNHWRRAYVLMAIGVPVLIWVTWQNGVMMGLLGLLVGGLVLRWPVYFLWRWLQERLKGG
ncbi:DUF2484 family protein [Yoonia sp.]|uniref:DUF2484 family protein n=1 Tax=Yoonia sp. TaxID=2212373 RepID=UPI0023B75F4D